MSALLRDWSSLAAAIAGSAAPTLMWGPAGGGWSFLPASRVIRCDPADLDRYPSEQLTALVAHEAAHAALSRYPELVAAPTLGPLALLLNTIEDLRVEAWLVQRFPGLARALASVNQRLFLGPLADVSALDLREQYCVAALHEGWFDRWPDGLDPAVAAALAETGEARRAAVTRFPSPADRDPRAYTRVALARAYARDDQRRAPAADERAARVAAMATWDLIDREIRPVFESLPDRQRARSIAVRSSGGGGGPPVTHAVAGGRVGYRVGLAGEPGVEPSALEGWSAASRAVQPLRAICTRALARPLGSGPRWGGTSTAGAQVDLRRVMAAAAADPRASQRVWRRGVLSRRRPMAALVWVDDASRLQAAERRGVVLVTEVFASLGVPHSVWGFHEVPSCVKDFDEPLSAPQQARIEALWREAAVIPGGPRRPADNPDGPSIREAVVALLARPESVRQLWVFSGGHPPGPADPSDPLAAALHQAARAGVAVLGGDAGGVADAIPRAVAAWMRGRGVA